LALFRSKASRVEGDNMTTSITDQLHDLRIQLKGFGHAEGKVRDLYAKLVKTEDGKLNAHIKCLCCDDILVNKVVDDFDEIEGVLACW